MRLVDGTCPGRGGSALWYFSNLTGLLVRGVTFRDSGAFPVQVRDAEDLHFRDVSFVSCHSDGIHVNGGVSRLWARSIRGKAGDDLIALNAWDWESCSTLNYGPIVDVVCEQIVNQGGLP